MEKVAIVGMGISGTGVLLAYHKLIKEKALDIELHLFDEDGRFGTGLPFSEYQEQSLNNSPSNQISFDYENLSDFEQWLNESPYHYQKFVPRYLYGQYNKERTDEIADSLNTVKHLEKVIKLDFLSNQNQWLITTANQSNLTFDRVHLCSGILPVSDVFKLKGHPQYIHRAYPISEFPDELNNAESVTIIGMGLTALDVTKYLLEKTNVKKINLFSREGIFPTIRGNDEIIEFKFLRNEAIDLIINEHGGYVPLEAIERILELELTLNDLSWDMIQQQIIKPGIDGIIYSIQHPEQIGKAQAICMQLSILMTVAWEAMSEDDRALYLKKYHKYVLNLRNPAPPETGIQIIEAVNTGNVEILPDVSDITPVDENGFVIALENPKIMHTDWIVNATGMKLTKDSELQEVPLISMMLNSRLIQIDSAGGLSINLQSGNIISPRFGELNTLHAHGMLIEGVVYQNNSTIKIQSFAEKIIRQIYL